MKCFNFKKPIPFFIGYLSGFLFSMYILSHLSMVTVWMESKMSTKHCTPRSVRDIQPELDTPLQRYKKHVEFHSQIVQCSGLFNAQSSEIIRAQTYLQLYDYTFPTFPENVFVPVTRDCGSFVKNLGYQSTFTKLEADFPLAFTMITHDKIEQVERLLRIIYSPQNIYCIHVDLKAPHQFLTAVKSLAKCFPNVFLTSRREKVIYASYSRLRAELNCIEDLLEMDKTWKYYLNLASSEIPLKTNLEIVKTLKRLNGSNDIEEMENGRHPERFMYRFEVEGDTLRRTHLINSPPPHNLTVTKGMAYGEFSRKFLEFTMTNKVAKEFLIWSQDTYSPDEHYWSTLNNLYHNPFLQTPGGSEVAPAKTRYISRYVKWKNLSKRRKCHGRYRHNICVFGFGDLPSFLKQNKLIANKFDLEFDPFAYACMEELLRNRTFSHSE